MGATMKKPPQLNLSDEAEMRAFYESCGISKSTTEAAIRLRLSPPVEETEKKSKLKRTPKADKRKDAPVVRELQR